MKVLITGISGYLGSLLAARLAADNRVESITGTDLREISLKDPKIRFVKSDIRDPSLADLLKDCDAAVHLAFIVGEIKDKALTYDININGTKNFFESCKKAGVKKIVYASSVAAYGSHPGKKLLTEDLRPAGNAESYYSDTKRLVEEMADRFVSENPGVMFTRMRPSLLCGKNTVDFFREVMNGPMIVYVKDNDEGLPIVYEQDVATAFFTAVVEDHPGIFNIHAGNLSPQKISEMTGKRAIGLSYTAARILIAIGYFTGLIKFSKHWVELGRYAFNISTEKARRELGWKPTRLPEEAFQEMIDASK